MLPCGSKIRSKSLFVMVSEIFSMFDVLLKSKMAAISGKNLNFYPLDTLVLHCGLKFTRNYSISYGF